MRFVFFSIPVHRAEYAASQLNDFLDQNNVLSVQREFVQDGANSAWHFCLGVQTLPTRAQAPPAPRRGERPKVDYKQQLSPEDFAFFDHLRRLRKVLAERDGVPVYGIFNNEQLARMVTDDVRTLAQLRAIEGVGEARAKRYGESFLDAMSSYRSAADASDIAGADPSPLLKERDSLADAGRAGSGGGASSGTEAENGAPNGEGSRSNGQQS